MDWIMLRRNMPMPHGANERTKRLSALRAVLEGRQYDHLRFAFSEEQSGAGEYVKLDQRRPSVKSNWARVVVEDSVSLLFSEGHWPRILGPNGEDETSKGLLKLIKQTSLNSIMMTAATKGSIGSSAVLFQVFDGVPYFQVLDTEFLTPLWDPRAPDTLIEVLECFQVKGKDLEAAGQAAGVNPEELFWHRRKWTKDREIWYKPQSLVDLDAPVEDPDRTIEHGLGFVPIAWTKNLPGGEGPDGGCTFECAIDIIIEADYLMSQGGRALKYASDPTLVIKGGGDADDDLASTSGGAANALELPPEADAKLLEINGAASQAVLAHVRDLRSMALEAMHGNRTHSDRVSVANSGRALEMMMTGLIWVADRLRISYGEGQLLELLQMACRASQQSPLVVGGSEWVGDPAGLVMVWKPWILPTQQELLPIVQALVTGVEGGIISAETAADRFGALVDVEDPKAEFSKIQSEIAERLAAEAAQEQAKAVRTAALKGKTLTKRSTA